MQTIKFSKWKACGAALLTFIALSWALLSAGGAAAQTASWPNRPIKLIVPFATGVSPDIVARLVADKLGQALGQPVVVDNRPGAGGMIGTEAAAGAPADGYTFVYAVKSVMAIAPHVYPNAKYNALKDFRPISEVLIVPHILTAAPNAPFNNMKELVDYAKRNPGKIDFASIGVGSQPHVALEAWASKLGIKLNHIPYKSNPSPDVMSGVVSLYLEASPAATPSIRGGKIKALGISGAERVPSLPDLPTMTEFNKSLDPNGVIGSSWHAFFAPAGTPDAIVNRMNTEIVKIVKTPEMQERMRGMGLTPTGTSANALNEEVVSNFSYWGQLVKELNIKIE
jgi:tripartite-type tricarboxylate transporter receptor subunit TctC